MEIGSVGSSSVVSAMPEKPPAPPKEITRSGLEEMRQHIIDSGGEVPEGLDTLIANFDDAVGSGGTMTMEEFKTYASDNGVTLPEPPKGGPGGPGGTSYDLPEIKTGGTQSSSESSSSSSDVSTLSDSELAKRAAEGDLKAIRELEKRAAATVAEDDSVGTTLNRFA